MAAIIRKLTAAEFTRPSNTTAYAAGQVVGPVTTPAVQTLTNAARYAGGGGYIRNARLARSGTTAITNATFRLHLYNTAPAALIADGTAWSLAYADREKYLGYIDLDTMVLGSSAAVAKTPYNMLPWAYMTAGGQSRKLYVVITAQAAYTPASAETFSLSATVELP